VVPLNANRSQTQPTRKEEGYGVHLTEDEHFMPFMNLEKFVVGAPDCPFELILQQFHGVLRDLLGSFCGGWMLSTMFKLSFPACYRNSTVEVRKMRRLYPLLTKLRESGEVQQLRLTGAIRKTERLLEHPQLSIDEAALIISEGHKILSELIEAYGVTTSSESINVQSSGDPAVVYKNLGEDKLTVFRKWEAYCKEKLVDLVSGVYIHGSMATLDYTDFSDLDVILVPKLETIEDPESLKELAYNCALSSCFLYRFNYLQHGGYLIISPHDLRCYNSSILPHQVFRYSKVVCGSSKIKLNVRNSRLDCFAYTWRMLQNIRSCAHRGFPVKNMWQLCVFTSFILILPVLYLQIVDDYVYKTFSFDTARGDFSSAEWEGVKTALEIRDMWDYQPTAKETSLAYMLLELKHNPMLFEYLMQKYSQKVSRNLRDYISRRDFYRNALLFSEAVAQRVCQLAAGPNSSSFSQAHSSFPIQ